RASYAYSHQLPPPARTPFFPYTTLFRSVRARRGRLIGGVHGHGAAFCRRAPRGGDRSAGPRAERRVASARRGVDRDVPRRRRHRDRKSTRLNSSHVAISYVVFCLIKKWS